VQAAWDKLEAHNPNDCRGKADWTKGLVGFERRWVPFNGAFGVDQLRSLETELQAASQCGDRVFVFSHVPLVDADTCCVAWDYEEALEVLDRYDCVISVLSGHSHKGCYRKRNNVHHITLQSPLLYDSTAAYILDVYESAFVLKRLQEGQHTIHDSGWTEGEPLFFRE